MTIALVDTSIFCNILGVPGKSQDYEEVYAEFKLYIVEHVSLLLPIATIIETGNHVAQVRNGQQRRQTAQRFTRELQRALDNKFPWSVPKPMLHAKALRQYLSEFPEAAMRGVSLGDLSIIKEYERQCKLNRDRHIFIWAKDNHLQSYDHPAKL